MTLYTPLWAQNASYSARTDRTLIDAAFGDPHVVDGLTVGERGLGANMTVDVQAGRVVVPGPLGNYLCVSDEIENLNIGAAPAAGTSRRDLVVAQVYDPQATGTGGAAAWEPLVVQGTAVVSNPVLPATPAWSLPLAEITVTSSTVSIVDSAVGDRRPLAPRPLGVLGVARSAVLNNQTGDGFQDIVGLSVAVTVGWNRRIRVSAHTLMTGVESGGQYAGSIREGVTVIGEYGRFYGFVAFTPHLLEGSVLLDGPNAGAHTYKASGSSTADYNWRFDGDKDPGWIMVEDLGPMP